MQTSDDSVPDQTLTGWKFHEKIAESPKNSDLSQMLHGCPCSAFQSGSFPEFFPQERSGGVPDEETDWQHIFHPAGDQQKQCPPKKKQENDPDNDRESVFAGFFAKRRR